MSQGITIRASAVSWLTPLQHKSVTADLMAMETTLNYDVTECFINDCLLRAEWANNRRWSRYHNSRG